MSRDYIDFLVSPLAGAPRSLIESIRLLSNSSSGFCRSWSTQELSDAEATSVEAFGLLDHIQNELLRRRDDRKNLPNWIGSPLEQALAQPVGELVEPATSAIELSFNAQVMGSGSIPAGATTTPLKLADALNKLKHRASNKVNFSISATGDHHLIVFTLGGMGRPNSIAAFDVQGFCVACKAAAGCI